MGDPLKGVRDPRTGIVQIDPFEIWLRMQRPNPPRAPHPPPTPTPEKH